MCARLGITLAEWAGADGPQMTDLERRWWLYWHRKQVEGMDDVSKQLESQFK